MNLTTNFDLAEFACKDGTPVPAELLPNVKRLAEQLQILRDYLDEPIHVNSGYRTPSYNKRVGGKPGSMHLKAKAADITVKSLSPKKLAGVIEMLIAHKVLKFGGMGLYPGFVHVDTRVGHARW